MNEAMLTKNINEYLDQNWEQIVEDINTLVSINSVEDFDHASEGAPYGPGPRAALDAALTIAQRMGFKPCNCEGYIGYADLPGKSETQIGIIGHTDVVPEATGWDFEPFAVTRKDGYLIGRGVLDDKGPLMVALHAVNLFKQMGEELPYTVRVLFGCNEETGMGDVAYYRKHYKDPAFLFTPDADFPVGYGEKGGLDGVFTSAEIKDGNILELQGGVAGNAVPARAHAVVSAAIEDLPCAENINITSCEKGVQIEAVGKAGHASLPQGTKNAIAILLQYLIDAHLCNEQEKAFFEMVLPMLTDYTGTCVEINSEDEYFDPLTIIGGIIELKDGVIKQHIDIRYPTSITSEQLEEKLSKQAKKAQAKFDIKMLMPPFLVKPDTPMIQALLDSYNEVTGKNGKPFTMGGGTYARHFTSAASFGPNCPWVENPEWVGSEHSANEGVKEEILKDAFKIYAFTIYKLMQIDF